VNIKSFSNTKSFGETNTSVNPSKNKFTVLDARKQAIPRSSLNSVQGKFNIIYSPSSSMGYNAINDVNKKTKKFMNETSFTKKYPFIVMKQRKDFRRGSDQRNPTNSKYLVINYRKKIR
jgi:hypothetical protein